jgi:hypothetical protein
MNLPGLSYPGVRPAYGYRSFAEVPFLIRRVLTGQPSRLLARLLPNVSPGAFSKVIFILADSLGWSFFRRFADHHPALQHFLRRGGVLRTTAQFPSTTSAHVTTIGTGQVVARHGVFEWQYYEPVLDAVIVPLMFSFAGDRNRNTLENLGVEPRQILPTRSFFRELQQEGIAGYTLLPREIAFSPYTRFTAQGAQIVPYRTLPEALINLRQMAAEQTSKACYYLYFPDIDSICHDYGPDSPQVEAEIDAFLSVLERHLLIPAERTLRDTLILMTADHGQTAVRPETTIYLNLHPDFPRLQPLLQTDRRGNVLPPGGSPRDVFLYVREACLDEAEALLRQMLDGRADVVRTAELVAQGLFGGEPSPALSARLSPLVILAHPGETVWWYEKDRFEQKFRGHHGGLSAEEMLTPLLALPC